MSSNFRAVGVKPLPHLEADRTRSLQRQYKKATTITTNRKTGDNRVIKYFFYFLICHSVNLLLE
jgi:hypothetical protein